MWWITLIDLRILKNPCIPGIKPTWSWCMIFLMCCWILIARILLRIFASMFIVALFIIARTWKQPRCPSADEWIKKMWYIYTMEYYSASKKGNNSIFSNMDGPQECHTEWSKSDREGQILYNISYMWNLKRNDTNESTK